MTNKTLTTKETLALETAAKNAFIANKKANEVAEITFSYEIITRLYNLEYIFYALKDDYGADFNRFNITALGRAAIGSVAIETPAAPATVNPFENGEPTDNYNTPYYEGDEPFDAWDAGDSPVSVEEATFKTDDRVSTPDGNGVVVDTLSNMIIIKLDDRFGTWQYNASDLTSIATQPAQPLAELETLRAKNAQLKEDHALSETLLDGYRADVLALQSGMKEKDAAFNELLGDYNELLSQQSGGDVEAHVFDALTKERNALRAALVQIRNTSDGDSELLKIAKQWSTVEQVERSLSNTVKLINSTLESE